MKIITVGRSPKNDVCIDDPYVSLFHCQFVQYNTGKIVLEDLKSSNGTLVNGQRISSTVQLHPKDTVQIGAVRLDWKQYFDLNGKKNNSHNRLIFIILGIILLAGIVSSVFFGLHNNEKKTRQFHINGVTLGFDMTQDDVLSENRTATIQPKRTSSFQRHEYYLINSLMAVTFEASSQTESHVNQICVWDPTYTTSHGISITNTFGDVVEALGGQNGDLTFWYFHSWYDYRALCYTRAVCLYDQSTCTGYIFVQNQFKSDLWLRVCAVVGNLNKDGNLKLSAFSSSLYKSICSEVTLSQIVMWNCESGAQQGPVIDGKSSTSNMNGESKHPAEQVVQKLMIATAQGDVETIKSLTTKDFYDLEYRKNSQYSDLDVKRTLLSVPENQRKKLISDAQNFSCEVKNTGQGKVVIRIMGGKKMDYYLKEMNGDWKCYDYASGGVHVPKSMRRRNY